MRSRRGQFAREQLGRKLGRPVPAKSVESDGLVHTSQLKRNLFLETTRGVLLVMVQGWGIVALAAVCDGSMGRY
jgi:hypothetical protein